MVCKNQGVFTESEGEVDAVQDFQVKISLQGPVAVIAIVGDLTHNSESRMFGAYEKATNAKARTLIFDFSQTEYINSAGMSVIISLLTRSQEAGQEMRAFGLSPHYQKIFDMVGLMKYIKYFDTEEAARKDWPETH